MNIHDIAIERPVGTDANKMVCGLFKVEADKARFDTISIPFECLTWEKFPSSVTYGSVKTEIFPGPFSKPFSGKGKLVKVRTVEELKNTDITNKIALLHGELSSEPLMPKDFPFYYPENHKAIIEILENSSPKAIIALTPKHPMCGLDPYPLFEDGNFDIPSAYMRLSDGKALLAFSGEVSLEIASRIRKAGSEQLIASRITGRNKGKIVVSSHMDTKYGTPGAIDNASGVIVLSTIMRLLINYSGDYDIDFVPFNGEEYFGVKGQLAYLDHIKKRQDNVKLVINIDAPGHVDSKTALSTYNFNSEMQDWIDSRTAGNGLLSKGEEWYAGDHSMFAFQGIPCIAVTSSNLMEAVLDITHTPNDTTENINLEILEETAGFLTQLIESYG